MFSLGGSQKEAETILSHGLLSIKQDVPNNPWAYTLLRAIGADFSLSPPRVSKHGGKFFPLKDLELKGTLPPDAVTESVIALTVTIQVSRYKKTLFFLLLTAVNVSLPSPLYIVSKVYYTLYQNVRMRPPPATPWRSRAGWQAGGKRLESGCVTVLADSADQQ